MKMSSKSAEGDFKFNPVNDPSSVKTPVSQITIQDKVFDQSEDEGFHVGLENDDNESIKVDEEERNDLEYNLQFKCYKVLRECFLVSTHPRIHRAAFRSQYGIYQERSRQLTSFPWIIHPYSLFRWIWDIFISVVLIITLIRQPLIIAYFGDDLVDRNEHIITAALGMLFIVDIIFNFCTGIVNQHSDVIILDPKIIARKYFFTWFFIDFFSTVPYDSVYFFMTENNKASPLWKNNANEAIKFLRLLELLKIFRLSRVIRYMTRLQEAYVMNTMYIRVINLHIIILLTLHWLACIHFLVADMMNTEEVKKPLSWVTRQNLWNETWIIKYINSVIRALSNMACLGYGNEVPREPEDMICTIISIMIGATFFALFVGNLSSILINMDVSQKKYAEVLNQVLEYMRFKQVPKELQSRVILYYEQRYRRNFFNEDHILANVSDVLRKELQMFNCRRLLDEVPLFTGLPQPVMQSIVARLKFEVYLPQDMIIGANAIGDAMYFLEHGAVSVMAPGGRVLSYLRDGQFFGEMALITNEKRNATVVATNFCDVYRLDKADFAECIKGYPEIYEHLMKLVEERDAQTNLDFAKTVPKKVKRKAHGYYQNKSSALKTQAKAFKTKLMNKIGNSYQEDNLEDLA